MIPILRTLPLLPGKGKRSLRSDAGLTIVQGGGVEAVVPLKQITEIRASNLSLMPEGLERSLSVPDLADRLALLKLSQQ
jgi:hypothetical protein